MEQIGHNNPPSPFELVQEKIEDLYLEAGNWLDGEEVSSDEYADEVGRLVKSFRATLKESEELRVKEKAPHLEASKAVDAKYKPLKEKSDRATTALKKALSPWLEKKDREQREREAEAARIAAEAEEKRLEAERRAAEEATTLEAQEAVDDAEEVARKAEIAAKSAANAKARVKGGAGRSIGLRTTKIPEITDPVAAIRHYWPDHKDAFSEVLLKLARADVRAGVEEIPGFEIREERNAA